MTAWIKSDHPWAYRPGQWARIEARASDLLRQRECYIVRWPDGVRDWWPVDDDRAKYEIRGVQEP